MVGLLLASIWTWAIIVGQWLRHAPRRRARARRSSATSGSPTTSTRFYEARGQSDLPARQGARRRHRRMAPLDRAARGSTAKAPASRLAVAMHSAVAAEIDKLAVAAQHPRHGRLGRALRRPVRHGLGDHAQLHRHRRRQQYQPRGGRARHRRGPVRDRSRPVRGDPGGDRLQSLELRHQPPRGAAPALRRRLPRARSAASWRVEGPEGRWRWAPILGAAERPRRGRRRRWRRSTSRRWST